MTTSSPKYSFVLPAYKGQFLKESIDSILAQSFKDFELIIVDDASPNGIRGVVSLYDDARIRYYRNEENIGGKNLVAQWNHSVEYANGDWIILATDDDIYESAFLETADRLLGRYPNVDIFRGRIASFNNSTPDSILFAEKCLPEYTCLEEFFYSRFHGLCGGIPQYVFRRSTLESIGGFIDFPIAWGSDDATAFLFAKKGIVCSSEYLVRFRNSGKNITSEGIFVPEKAVATLMFYAYYYNKILPMLSDDSIYKRHWNTVMRNFYPFEVKRPILKRIYDVPWLQRRMFLDLIDKYTPYLDSRNKMTMKIRVFFKVK